MYDVYCKFDIEKHKAKYIDYLEVVILEDGTIEYAVPSHQEKLISIACEKKGIDRKTFVDSVPVERYLDFMEWLLEETGAVAVWNEYVACKKVTKKQIGMLRKLKMNGLYRGAIPDICRKGGDENK